MPDLQIWQYALEHGLTIVSKDNDFRQLSFLYGPPPKVIWLSVGNAGTDIISWNCFRMRHSNCVQAAEPLTYSTQYR